MSPESHQKVTRVTRKPYLPQDIEEQIMTVRRTPTLFLYRGKWRVTFVDQHGTTRSKALATKTDGYRFIAQ
jgi:hypothetical protein